MKAPSDITALRRKTASGQPITEEERAALRAYNARYYERKKTLHIKGGRHKEWQELADKQGLSLSAWIQEQVLKGLYGNEEALKDLRQENERLRDEIASLRGTTGQFSLENSKLQARIEGLETSLKGAMERILGMQEKGA